MIRVSVVIASRDRPTQLATCLRALAASFPDDAETIVVSDGGVDSGIELFRETLRLRVIAGPHGGPAAARNRGLAAADGEVVAFVDDDCIPRPDWLESLTTGFGMSSPPRAAGGTTLNGLPANPYADVSQLIIDLVAQYDRAARGGEQFVPANNVAFAAGALRELGGFDESYRTAEDRELCRRWLGAGYELHRVPDAIVEHRPRLDLKSFVRQFYAYGQGAARFHASHDGSLRASAAFHTHLPGLLAPAVARRGIARGARLVGLIGLWEIASIAGYVMGDTR